MKPRRAMIIAGGTMIAVLSIAGIVAEKLGIDTMLLVEQLWQDSEPSAEPPAQPAEGIVAADSAGEPREAGEPHETAGPEQAAAHSREQAGHSADPATQREAGVHGEAATGEGPSADTVTAQLPAAPKTPDRAADTSHVTTGEGGNARDDPSSHDHASAGEGDFNARGHILPPGRDQPWRLFRAAQRKQDGIVLGQPGALDAYRAEMADAAERMMALPATAWNHERNVISAAAYVMAGGKPELARNILARTNFDGPARKLLEGALAYAEGQYYEAYNLLYSIEPADQPVSVAGQVALVKAMLVSPRSLEQALAFLDQARQLAPGTLVEEASLRRQIRVLAELDDLDGFFREAGTYMRRYSRSAFLSDFLRNFAFGTLRLSEKHQERVTREIEAVTPRLDANAKLYLFSLLARGATVFGQFDLAREASLRSLDLASDNPRLAQRLSLYLAASSLTWSDKIPDAIERLKNIDDGLLGIEDARLLKAALLVAQQIRKPLDEMNKPAAAGQLIPDVGRPVGEEPANGGQIAMEIGEDALPPILKRSDSALKQADKVLGW